MTARATLRALTALLAPLTLAAIVAGVIPAAGAAVRATLGATFQPRPGTLDELVAILEANARVAAVIVLAAVVVSRAPGLRRATDGVLAVLLGANMLLIGAAMGAYGDRVLKWLVHLPLELGGLAVALAVYLAGRSAPVSLRVVVLAGIVALGVLLAGAGVETYLTPQR